MNKTLLKSMLVAGMLTMGLGAQAQTDVTEQYVINADLSIDPATADNGWTLLNGWRQDYKKAEDDQHVNVVEFYAGWGSLEKTEYAMTQTISLPAGYYRLSVNAFYRHGNDGNGTNDFAYIFAGEKKQNVYALANFYTICNEKGYQGSSDLWKASNGFFKGDFLNAFDFTMETAGEIEIGFEGTFDTMRSWVILGPVKLYQYTKDDYIDDYVKKLGEADAIIKAGDMMDSEVLAELQAAMVDESNLQTVDDVVNAIQALSEAINKAESSIAIFKDIANAIQNLQDKYPTVDFTAIWASYSAGLITSKADIYPEFQTMVAASLGTADGTDFTAVIINPSFEWGNYDGWTVEPSGDTGAKENSNEVYTIENADGDYVFNIWSAGNRISQNIVGLPNGQYQLQALIATDTDHYVTLIANEETSDIYANENGKGVGEEGTVDFNVTDGTATIGAEGGEGFWYKVDNFRLTLVKADVADGIKTVATEKENATIFNLAGQQVRNAQKGIFIQNGKKYIK